MIREAGGAVTTLEGAPVPIAETSLVAGNPEMHAWLLETLKAGQDRI
jgi:fructose-1,6-bisphosphatase/inositol monophosphatase family enzyme